MMIGVKMPIVVFLFLVVICSILSGNEKSSIQIEIQEASTETFCQVLEEFVGRYVFCVQFGFLVRNSQCDV